MKRYQPLFEKSFQDYAKEAVQAAVEAGILTPPSPELQKVIYDLRANLYHGPSVGDWSDSLLNQVRDWMYELPTLYYDSFSRSVSTEEPREEIDEESGETMYPGDEIYEIDSSEVARQFVGKELYPYIL